MFTLREQLAEFYNKNKLLRKLLAELAAAMPAYKKGVAVAHGRMLNDDNKLDGRLYLLKEGFLRCKRGDKTLFFIEPGDLIGFPDIPRDLAIVTDSDVVLDEYGKKTVLQTVRRDPALFILWTKFLDCQLHLALSLIREDDEQAEEHIDPAELSVRRGVAAGRDERQPVLDAPVRGTADVYVGDTKMGMMASEDVFRAISEMADHGQTAVTLEELDRVVVEIPKEVFLALVKNHPDTVLKMIDTMSRTLSTQNTDR